MPWRATCGAWSTPTCRSSPSATWGPRDAGDILNRVSKDTRHIQRFINFWLTDSVAQVLFLIGVALILFLREWRLAVLVLVPVPVVMLIAGGVWSHVRSLFRKQERLFDKVDTLLQDILSGIRVVKAFGRERAETGRFRARSRELREMMFAHERIWANHMPLWSFVMRAGEFLVFALGGYLVLGERMKLGELVQFVQYAMLLYGPLIWIAGLPRRFAESMTAAERVFEVIDEQPQVADSRQPRRLPIAGRVRFEGVVFGYQSHEPVLDDVSLEVAPGEMIGIVGHSGAGKSTLINLLLRLYDPDAGRITIDGVDLRAIELRDLHRQLGVVLQETFLFSGSIAENIAYAQPDATLQQLIAAAKVAGAHDFICAFPDGYDYPGGRTWPAALRRRAPARRHRPRHPPRPAHPDPGRGHRRGRHRDRGADPGRPVRADEGAHHLRHRSSPLHPAPCRPAGGARPGPPRRGGHPCRADGRRRHLPRPGAVATPHEPPPRRLTEIARPLGGCPGVATTRA